MVFATLLRGTPFASRTRNIRLSVLEETGILGEAWDVRNGELISVISQLFARGGSAR